MRSALEISKTQTSTYPLPSNYIEITYSWSILWYQWTFWKTVVQYLWTINEVPIDPLTWNEYTYSLSGNKNFYEIWSISETH